MILNLRGYYVEIRYIPGSKQFLADTLSRGAVQNADKEECEEFQEINMILSESYEEFQKDTKADPELQAVLTMVNEGWPETKQEVPVEARVYWTFGEEVATTDGLLFKGTRLVVSKALRPEMLRQIHKSHMGMFKCRQRARDVLFLPGMSLDVE